ncbi:ATP synthase F0 subunit B [Anaerobacillus sp. CMMVII]|uniref:ATP synthase F0 subunit B n=1 Tax=Anaerobacillus sp. CMMVII TaxID=2755588 RepID=UPI0021B808E7|nr:ATP synthase F0 subunit B [Anaerobacillus sp. CMMVII]MCT8136861.1 ATP synthase F0 subunit B [Anaerobacillus sp. CMMVII]
MGDITIFGMPVSLGTMIYQAVVFTALFWILHKLCLKKVVGALERRKDHIANQLKMTEQYKEEARQKLTEQERLLLETRQEIVKMRLNCKEESELILRNARDEAYKIRTKAYEEQQKRFRQGA